MADSVAQKTFSESDDGERPQEAAERGDQAQPDDAVPNGSCATEVNAASAPEARADAPAKIPVVSVQADASQVAESPTTGDAQVDTEPVSADVDDTAYLVRKGISSDVAKEMVEMFKKGYVDRSGMDERTLEMIGSMRSEQAIYVFQQFCKMSLLGVKNRPAYLNALLKHFRDRVKTYGEEVAFSRALMVTPKEEDTKTLLDRTGYDLEVTIGQRKYSMPGCDETTPSAGCEIYVGKIPKIVFEPDLVPLFEQCGKIRDLRIMMDPVSGLGKGYGFVTFVDREAALISAEKFEGYEIKPGKRLRVNVSVANTRLFVGNIPKNKGKEEILDELSKISGPLNITEVIIYPNPSDPVNKKNRGFCFLDFADHKSASQAKRRMSSARFRPWNVEVVVEWAETQESSGAEAQNKTLYIRPLKEAVTEETLKEQFSAYGVVERVKRIKDYAFVHFSTHEQAAKAMTMMKGHPLDGVPCEISYAKPPSEKKGKRMEAPSSRRRNNNVYGNMMSSGHEHRDSYINPFESPQPFSVQSQGAYSAFIGQQHLGTPIGGRNFIDGYGASAYGGVSNPYYPTNTMSFGNEPFGTGAMMQQSPLVNLAFSPFSDVPYNTSLPVGYGIGHQGGGGGGGGGFMATSAYGMNSGGGGGDGPFGKSRRMGQMVDDGDASGAFSGARPYKRKIPTAEFRSGKKRSWQSGRRYQP